MSIRLNAETDGHCRYGAQLRSRALVSSCGRARGGACTGVWAMPIMPGEG